jgi:uncharacterized protein (DUF433 family)
MLRDGATFEKILQEYPKLTKDDIQAVLDYSLYLINQENEELIKFYPYRLVADK